MTSAHARLGAALAVASLATVLPLVAASPASAVVALDSAAPTASTAPATATALVGATPATVPTTATALVGAATYSLPTLRTGYVRLSAAAKADPVVRGRAAVATAKRFAGIRYVAGGTSPSTGFDCSGYTRYVFSRLGIALPRVSRDQYRASIAIKRSQAVPGDLVFFYSSSGRIYHVSIYAGNGYIWHSPYPGQRVKLEKIWSSRVKFARVRV